MKDDAATLIAGSAYLDRAGALYAQFVPSGRRLGAVMRHVHRDEHGTLTESWCAAIRAETQLWQRLCADILALDPPVPVQAVHARLQRFCAEVSAAARDYEAAIAPEDAALVDAAGAHLDRAMALQDEITRQLARIMQEMRQLTARTARRQAP